jgi:hypothetical protein
MSKSERDEREEFQLFSWKSAWKTLDSFDPDCLSIHVSLALSLSFSLSSLSLFSLSLFSLSPVYSLLFYSLCLANSQTHINRLT